MSSLVRAMVAVMAGALLMASCANVQRTGEAPDAHLNPSSLSSASLASSADTLAPSRVTAEPGNLVERLQLDLADLGFFRGPFTSEYDESTKAAILAFEHDLGLPADGMYDLHLAALIDLARGRAQGPSVWALQSALGALGYYAGPADGALNPSLVESVRRLQLTTGLEPTGEYGKETAKALLDDLRTAQPAVGWVYGPAVEAPEPRATAATESETPSSPSITQLQLRLDELGYRPGLIDGELGPAGKAAVMAFQKREGLEVDGIVGPATTARLRNPQGEGPRSSLPVPRIEIDLARQIAFVVAVDGSFTTIAVSTGNGKPYVTETGATAVAYTPTGMFSVRRVIDGVREAPLGTLYRPLYFHGGWAIHGSGHVPAYPASHGCVRTHMVDQDWLFEVTGVATAVVIYDDSRDDGHRAPPAAAPGS